jgi:hypothetical protein
LSVIAPALTLAVTVLVAACVVKYEPVVTPLALVAAAGCVTVFPVTGLTAIVTVRPLIPLPN